MESPLSGLEKINSFALVSYLPGVLGAFLDRLRTELVSACIARSHVTILPPRLLASSEEEAKIQIADRVSDFAPFQIDLGQVEVFPRTQVIYLSLYRGGANLRTLHDALNAQALGFDEPFEYHPHVTLAQSLDPLNAADALALATARWKEFLWSRSFEVERLTFVQNTNCNRWVDLAQYELGSMAAVRNRR